MADKDFKVKNGLDLGVPLSIAEGGTGQSTASNAINALLPVQTSALNNFLYSDGTNVSWAIPNYSEVANSGVVQNTRKTLNFIGATIQDDPSNNRTNVTIEGGSSLAIVAAFGL